MHPREALFEAGETTRLLPVCDHYSGVEARMRKSLELQVEMGPVFDVTLDNEDGAPVGGEADHARLISELILSPRPKPPHASVASMLGGELIPSFSRGTSGSPGGWIILVEPEIHFGKRVLVPDLAGWRTSRMSHIPMDEQIALAPDWVCEIASKSTEKLDRKRKLPIYASAGVGHAWIVHPRNRSLDVMRLVQGKYSLIDVFCDSEKIRAEPFEQIELDLANLWWAFPTLASEGAVEYGEIEF